MKPNTKLLVALKEEGFTQRDFAKIVNEHETVISRFVNGFLNPTETQKIKCAKALKCKPGDLFDD